MNATELRAHLSSTLSTLKESADELRDLDQALGDGDLGITVSAGADAVIAAFATMTDDSTPIDVIRAAAKAFANANPSTMAALVAGGLLAGSRTWEGVADISVADAANFAKAAGESISQRGKSRVGDKTILDALVPAADALADAEEPTTALNDAIAAAENGVIETQQMQSRRGRASWLQERSIGLQDPGATALLRFLESWKSASAS